MKSPFPGMDPYIEASGLWRPFHARLIGRIIDALEEALPPKYSVRPDERNVVELVEAEGKTSSNFYPDVGVVGTGSRPTTVTDTAAVARAAPASGEVSLRPFIADRFREQFIEITVDDPERRLVTCIEVLSPSNKRNGTDARTVYLRKRQALLLGEANLVEIDLLRGGARMPMLDPWPGSPYTLLVGRRGESTCRVWPAHYLHPLPELPVPLDDPDPDVALDLQSMVAAVYERGRYARDIDYTKPLDPPLGEAEQAWLLERLKQARE